MSQKVGEILNKLPFIKMNEFLNICPSCHNTLKIYYEWVREDFKYRSKVIERELQCTVCRVKIRQCIYLE